MCIRGIGIMGLRFSRRVSRKIRKPDVPLTPVYIPFSVTSLIYKI